MKPVVILLVIIAVVSVAFLRLHGTKKRNPTIVSAVNSTIGVTSASSGTINGVVAATNPPLNQSQALNLGSMLPQASQNTAQPQSNQTTSNATSQPTPNPDCGQANYQQFEDYRNFVSTLQVEMDAYYNDHNSTNDINYQSEDSNYASQLDASSRNFLDGAYKVVKSYGCVAPYPTFSFLPVYYTH